MEIELIKWTKENYAELAGICNRANREYLSNRLPNPYTQEDALWWINMVSEREGKEGIYRGISVDGEIIGNISIERKEDVYSRDAEIGYLLVDDKKNLGIMSEAVRKICIIGAKEMDIIRITGLVYKPNIASIRVLEKNGFKLEGTIEKGVVKDNNIYDLCIYGKILI